MTLVGDILRRFEGGRVKCILCRRSVNSAEIKGDGVGVCKSCYDRIMKTSAKDYYETGSYVKRLFAPFAYRDNIRDAIFEFKFGGSYAYGDVFAELVFKALPPYYLYDDYDMIVPVPLSVERFNERGFNQAELFAVGLSKRLGIPLVNDVLFRTRNTLRQMTLTRNLRERNVDGAFYAVESEVSGKKILIADDIYTAGATARACAKELLSKGAKEVSAVVIGTNFYDKHRYTETVKIPTVMK